MRSVRILLALAVAIAAIAGVVCLVEVGSRDGLELGDGAAPNPSEAPVDSGAGAFIQGVVRDASGLPIADAYILAIPVLSGGRSQSIAPEALLQWTGGGSSLSDGQGGFAISGLAFDTPYYLSVQHDGFASATSPEFRLVRGQAAPPLEFTLETGSTLAGTALLEDGSPARSQWLHLARFAEQDAALSLVDMVRTDDEGQFVFAHVPAGAYLLGDKLDIANPERTERNVARIAADGRTSVSNLTLCISQTAVRSRSGVIRGAVRGPDGQPVEQAELAAYVDATRVTQSLSAGDGTFVLDGIPEGVYTLKGRSEFGVATVERVATGTDVTLTLRAMPTLSGVVMDNRGSAVPLCTVRLLPFHRDEKEKDTAGDFLQSLDDIFESSDPYAAVSDGEGLFVIPNVEPGIYTVEAASPIRGIGAFGPVTVTEGTNPPRLTVRLDANAQSKPFGLSDGDVPAGSPSMAPVP